jgi:hydroxymethylpyrimidine pyrophosphatase-like HAD family hydrolase
MEIDIPPTGDAMRFRAIGSDYDGTLAREGEVTADTWNALERARESGRKLILVTGRELPSLRDVFSGLHLFDRIVAENGALLYHPGTGEERLLCSPASKELAANLRKQGIPISVGKCVIATVRPHEAAVAQAVRELNLHLHLIFNMESVMILPREVNKTTGLSAVLSDLGIPRESVVGIGDAENDHEFLNFCGCSVAVANALPALKQRANMVTLGSYGAGVVEVINRLIDTDRLC